MARRPHGGDSVRRRVQERAARKSRGGDPPEQDKVERRFQKADTLAEAVTLLLQEADPTLELTDETRRKLVEVAEAHRGE
jgi:predicted ABC-type ATPase